MKKLKKLVLLCIICVLMAMCFPAAALAADLEDCSIANGVVEAVKFVDLTAPFTGTLESFNLHVGDRVSAGSVLMKMMLSNVYAPIDGKISYIFAKPGDDATVICNKYGGLIGVEPKQLLKLNCNNEFNGNEANAGAEDKMLHLGEKVYLRSGFNNTSKGEGVIVSVESNHDYVVEVTKDENLKVTDMGVRIYRDPDFKYDSYIGSGDATRCLDALPTGEGRVYKVYVETGDEVTTETLLIQLLGADAEPNASPMIIAPNDAVIGLIAVESGSTVWKGQELLRLYLTDNLQVRAQVDEVDLKNVHLGDTISVKLDTDKSEVIEGVVTSISSVGEKKSNAAYFDVCVSVSSENAKVGVSASVYISKE